MSFINAHIRKSEFRYTLKIDEREVPFYEYYPLQYSSCYEIFI